MVIIGYTKEYQQSEDSWRVCKLVDWEDGEEMDEDWLADLCTQCQADNYIEFMRQGGVMPKEGIIENMRQTFTDAIEFAIRDDEPREFLTAWNEGDWKTLKNEWPEFKLPTIAR